MEFNFFNDAMKIYLDYISRQFKKNPNYKPHPLIRALTNAMDGIETAKEGENVRGISFEGTENNIYEPYMVIVQKTKGGIEIKKILNLKVKKEIPIDVMIMIFRLQIQLDKIDGETVSPQQLVDALNEVIPGNKFYALGDRWKEARDRFAKLLNEGKINLAPNDPKIEEFKRIDKNTPWENYSNGLRALIGPTILYGSDMNKKIVITTPTNARIEKYKVFDFVTEFMLRENVEYFRD
ncbi:MAG TPA: hypothetical protein PLD16_06000 [Fervidobacterium sp.]|nr:hypothetical protein [Fervidobacterium sp.]